jgi:undecaprenyl-diphosphatase
MRLRRIIQVLHLCLSKLPKPHKHTKLNFMKLSWSHLLFFRINALIGKHPFRDRVMIFGARWLIFVMLGLIVLGAWSGIFYDGESWLSIYLQLFVIVFVVAECISYLFGLLFRHPRPRIEFPESRQLVHTVGTWKSFPSDHTIGAFLLAGTLWFIPVPLFFVIGMYLLATWVASARVYVGVHYPRDIVGGFIVAHVVLGALPWIWHHIIEPIAHL